MKLKKLKKPVVRPTFPVKLWCVNLMFKLVLEKVFEFSFDSIICPFFRFQFSRKVVPQGNNFFEEIVAQVAAISH